MANKVLLHLDNNLNRTAQLRVFDIETGAVARTQIFTPSTPGSISAGDELKLLAKQWADNEYRNNYRMTFEGFDEETASGYNTSQGAIMNSGTSVVSEVPTEEAIPGRSVSLSDEERAENLESVVIERPMTIDPPTSFGSNADRVRAQRDDGHLENRNRQMEVANLATGGLLEGMAPASFGARGATTQFSGDNPDYLGPENPLGELEEDIVSNRYRAELEQNMPNNLAQTVMKEISPDRDPEVPVGMGEITAASSDVASAASVAGDILDMGLSGMNKKDKPLEKKQPNVSAAVQLDGLSKEQQKILSNLDSVARTKNRGIAGDVCVEPVPGFVELNTEKVISNRNNAWIVLGRDRVDSRGSGYGGKGHTQCAAIDLVCGRMSPRPRTVDFKGKPIYVDPMPTQVVSEYGNVVDAARIYISQKTDIDDNFGLAKGRIGNKVARSAIALKADGIRVVGREGIKLITRGDVINSQGGRLTKTAGIDIIAGNDDKRLQPMCLGNNVTAAFSDLCKILEQIAGTLQGCVNNIAQLDSALAMHFHISPFFGAPTLPSPVALSMCIASLIEMVSVEAFSIVAEKWNMNSFRMKYLKSGAPRCIRSRYNNNN